MDTLTIILLTVALSAFAGLAFIGGWELGITEGADRQRAIQSRPARPTVTELIDNLNTRRPKAAKNRRKAARKAVRA